MPKAKIYATVRNAVWTHYNGDQLKIKCFCCNTEEISRGNYECGHVVSEKNGGDASITNLRPICSLCNKSMGIKSMDDFMVECGFQKSRHWNGFVPPTEKKVSRWKLHETDPEVCKERIADFISEMLIQDPTSEIPILPLRFKFSQWLFDCYNQRTSFDDFIRSLRSLGYDMEHPRRLKGFKIREVTSDL